MGVDSSSRHKDVITLNVRNELIAGKNVPRLLRQEEEDLELCGCEDDFFLVHNNPALRDFDRKITKGEIVLTGFFSGFNPSLSGKFLTGLNFKNSDVRTEDV